MYHDKDGVASKESEAAYKARIRLLVWLTSFLSWLGLAAAITDIAHYREIFQSLQSLIQLSSLHWSKLLWASSPPPFVKKNYRVPRRN